MKRNGGVGVGYRIPIQTLPVTTLRSSYALLPVPLSWFQGLPEGTAGWQVGSSRAFRRVFPEPLRGCVCVWGAKRAGWMGAQRQAAWESQSSKYL